MSGKACVNLERTCFHNGGYCWQLARFAGRGGWRWKRFQAVFVSFEHPRQGRCLIDTGYGPDFWRATRRFPQRVQRWMTPVRLAPGQDARSALQARGVEAEDIRWVFVSHFHADHIGGLAAFPAAQFVYREDALAALRGMSALAQVRHGFLPQLLPDDFPTRATALCGEQFQAGEGPWREFRLHDFWQDGSLLLVDLPGHALGHLGFLWNAASGPVLFVADACWDVEVMRRDLPLPWLARRFQQDYAAYRQTQQRLRGLLSRADCQVVACHCPATQQIVQSRRDDSNEAQGAVA